MALGWLTIELVLAGLAGGIVGAAMGGLPALSLAGVVLIVGEATGGVGGSLASAASAGGIPSGSGLAGAVGLGPLLGPHVAFAGGVAAAAYAGRRGEIDTDIDYHVAKDVTVPLGSSPDVLLVGGIFGLVGVLVAVLSVEVGLPVDPIALSVVCSGVFHRIAFGYPIVGSIGGDPLDMSPYENRVRRGAIGHADADAAASPNGGTGAPATGGAGAGSNAGGGRFAVEPWQPHHYEWANVLVLGLGVGVGSGFLALATGSAFLAFGLTAATLAFLALGMEQFPVTHHMALPASIAALALPGAGAGAALVLAGVFGALGGVIGELAQRLFYAHADTHFDPPMVAILVTSLVLTVLATANVLEAGAIPYPVL